MPTPATFDPREMTQRQMIAHFAAKYPHLCATDDDDDDTCGTCHGGADREHPCPSCGTSGYIRRDRYSDGEYDEDYYRDTRGDD